MKRIIITLLEAGILEEDIHRVLDLIEEEYNVINELLPANKENVMRTRARRQAASNDKEVAQKRVEKASKDWDKNYNKYGMAATSNLNFQKDVANRAKEDHANKEWAEMKNSHLTRKWKERHPDKDWDNINSKEFIDDLDKQTQYAKDARKEEDKKFPTYDMKNKKVIAAKKEDKFHPKDKPEARDIEQAYGIDDVDVEQKVKALEKLHDKRSK